MIAAPRFRVDLRGTASLVDRTRDAREAFESVWERLAIGRDWRARCIVRDGDGDGDALFLKGLQIPAVAGTQHWMRRFHIAWEFRNLVAFRDSGIALPTPLGWGCETRAGLPMRSFLVTRAIPDVLDLEQIARDPGGARLGPEERRHAFRSAGRAVRRMHESGIVHGDLACRNLLVRGAGGIRDVTVVDVPRARRRCRLSVRDRRIDLYRITKSSLRCRAEPEDILALLAELVGSDAPDALDAVRRIRAIRQRAARKVRREVWLATGR